MSSETLGLQFEGAAGDSPCPSAITARGASQGVPDVGKGFAVELWDGGTCIEVKRLVPAKSGAARVSLHVDGKLNKFAAKLTVPAVDGTEGADGPVEGAVGAVEVPASRKRGKIASFSRKSRRRLLQAIHKLKKDARCLFVTLTLPDGVEHDGKSLKAWKRAWWLRVTRRFPKAAAVWRLECKARKSGAEIGKPVAHLHLLLYGIPIQPGLVMFVHDSWGAVVGASARTRVEVPKSNQRVQAYASKLYSGKAEDDVVIPDVGRYWGFLAEAFMPWAVLIVVKVTMAEGFRLLRALRGYIRSQRRAKGKSPPGRLTQWRFFFVDDPGQWLGVVIA